MELWSHLASPFSPFPRETSSSLAFLGFFVGYLAPRMAGPMLFQIHSRRKKHQTKTVRPRILSRANGQPFGDARCRRDPRFKRIVDVGAGTGRMASWLTKWNLEAARRICESVGLILV